MEINLRTNKVETIKDRQTINKLFYEFKTQENRKKVEFDSENVNK